MDAGIMSRLTIACAVHAPVLDPGPLTVYAAGNGEEGYASPYHKPSPTCARWLVGHGHIALAVPAAERRPNHETVLVVVCR